MRLVIGCGILLLGGLAGSGVAQVNGGAAVGTSLNVSTLTTGNVLSVSGAASADRRYVGLNVHIQSSTLDGIDTITVPGGIGNGGGSAVGGGGGGGVVAGLASVRLPEGLGVRKAPYRSAQVGRVVFVETDKKLLPVKVAKMEMRQVSVKEAVKRLAVGAKVNLVLGIKGLEQAGADLNEPHDFVVEEGTVKEALLAVAKVGLPGVDLVMTAEDRVIMVATQAQGDNAIITKTYYLQDVMGNVGRWMSAADFDKVGRSGAYQATDLSKAPAAGGAAVGAAVVEKPKVGRPTSIAEMITSTVRPEVWKVNGGKYGEVRVFGTQVTITAPASVHALLDGPSTYRPATGPLYVGYGR